MKHLLPISEKICMTCPECMILEAAETGCAVIDYSSYLKGVLPQG